MIITRHCFEKTYMGVSAFEKRQLDIIEQQRRLEMVLSGKVKATTDLSVLVEQEETEFEEGWKEWFPKSQCPDLEEAIKGEQVEFECPDWLAKEKGF